MAVVACVAALSACGQPEPATPVAVVEPGELPIDSDYPPVPTPEQLNTELLRGLDPAVPTAEKSAFVQGAEEDPALIEEVVAAIAANNAVVEITSIDDLGDGTLNVGTTLTVSGTPNPGTMTFVAEDQVWKLSRDNACAIVSLAGLASAACPAA